MNPTAAVRDAGHDRRQRRMLIALALFFFAPLAASFFLYYGSGGWRPGNRVNHGDLIDPARPLPEVALPLARDAAPIGGAGAGGPGTRAALAQFTRPDFLRNKWTLLYWGSGICTARCRTDLYNMRQVRIALNRDMDRVQRVFIAEGACCDWPYLDREHPDLLTVRATQDARPLLTLFPPVGAVAAADADRIYLIDPLGNLMMSFAPDSRPKGMLQDLKRLLGLSQVG
jgi:hypothetical protein